jgi:hypothetical protein
MAARQGNIRQTESFEQDVSGFFDNEWGSHVMIELVESEGNHSQSIDVS